MTLTGRYSATSWLMRSSVSSGDGICENGVEGLGRSERFEKHRVRDIADLEFVDWVAAEVIFAGPQRDQSFVDAFDRSVADSDDAAGPLIGKVGGSCLRRGKHGDGTVREAGEARDRDLGVNSDRGAGARQGQCPGLGEVVDGVAGDRAERAGLTVAQYRDLAELRNSRFGV